MKCSRMDRAGNELYLDWFRDQGPGAREMGFECLQDQTWAQDSMYYSIIGWGGLTGRAA